MIVRLDLEGASPALANVDDAGVLAGPLQHQLAAGGEAFQMHARRLVGAMLTPHDAENAEFGERRLTSAEQFFDLFVLVSGKPVLPDRLRGNGRSQGSRHGKELLLSHFGVLLG